MRKTALCAALLASWAFAGAPAWQPEIAAAAQDLPAGAEQKQAIQLAHQKASLEPAYHDAVLAGDVSKARELLIKNGAPGNIVVSIDDKRHGGGVAHGGSAAAERKWTVIISLNPPSIKIIIEA